MKRGTPRHPKVDTLMRLAKVTRATAVGWLELLWHATAEFAPQGDIGKCSDAWIEAQLDWHGKPGKLIRWLVESGWMDYREGIEGGSIGDPYNMEKKCGLLVHDWHEHADDAVRKRLTRLSLPFLTVADKVTGQSTVTDRKVSGTLPDNGSQPEPSQSLARAKPSPPSVDSEDPGRPPLDTDPEDAPAIAKIRDMLVEFTRGRLGIPDDRVCLKLLHFAGGDPNRVEGWLVTKSTRRDQIKKWGWFIQAGEAELRQARVTPISPPPNGSPPTNLFDPKRDLTPADVALLAEGKAF